MYYSTVKDCVNENLGGEQFRKAIKFYCSKNLVLRMIFLAIIGTNYS